MYYKPDWGKFNNGVFVRDQKYKLYGDGRFYDVENDVLEQNPLPQNKVVGDALTARETFQAVLNQKPSLSP